VLTILYCFARIPQVNAQQTDVFFFSASHPISDWMNVVSWHEFPKGGHFAAFERPVEYEKEIVDFFTSETVLDLFTAKRLGYKI